MFLFVCNLYLPANAQLTRTQQDKRVAGISFLEVPDVMTSGNKEEMSHRKPRKMRVFEWERLKQ